MSLLEMREDMKKGGPIKPNPPDIAVLKEGDTKAIQKEMVNHPDHYGGKDNPYEVAKIVEAWGIDKDAYLFSAIKYLFRKDYKWDSIEDLKKAIWYIQRRIDLLEGEVFYVTKADLKELSEPQK